MRTRRLSMALRAGAASSLVAVVMMSSVGPASATEATKLEAKRVACHAQLDKQIGNLHMIAGQLAENIWVSDAERTEILHQLAADEVYINSLRTYLDAPTTLYSLRQWCSGVLWNARHVPWLERTKIRLVTKLAKQEAALAAIDARVDDLSGQMRSALTFGSATGTADATLAELQDMIAGMQAYLDGLDDNVLDVSFYDWKMSDGADVLLATKTATGGIKAALALYQAMANEIEKQLN